MLPIEPATLSTWLAWVQLVAGVVMLVVGWRARGRTGELLAPGGVLAIVGSGSHFLFGKLPDSVVIAIDLIAMLGCAVWFVRLYRASRARIAELRRQRDATQSLR